MKRVCEPVRARGVTRWAVVESNVFLLQTVKGVKMDIRASSRPHHIHFNKIATKR